MNSELKKKKSFTLPKEARDMIVRLALFLFTVYASSVRFIFGTYPFGFILLASSKKDTPFVFVGCLASVFFFLDANVIYLVAYIALLGLRIAGSLWVGESKRKSSLGKETKNTLFSTLFCENAAVRVALCALCSFGVSVFDVIANDYNYYNIFVLVFITVFSGIMTFALSGLFEGVRSQSFYIGLCALSFIGIFSIAEFEIFSLDVSIILTYALVLYVSKSFGLAKACALGGLLGICHGENGIGIFVIVALVSGLMWNFSYYFAILSALALALGYAIFQSGYQAIVYFLPEAIFSSLMMYSLLRFEVLPKLYATGAESSQTSIEVLRLGESERALRSKISTLGSSFKEIGEVLGEASALSKAPDRERCQSMCLEICENHCYSCPKRSICWEKDVRTTEENIISLSSALFSADTVSKERVSEKFLHRCPNIEIILEEISEKKRDITEGGVKYDKIDICAQNYDSISKMLDTVCEKGAIEAEKNLALSEKADRAAKKIGLKFDKIEVLGARFNKIIATGVDTQGSKCSDTELKEALERIVGTSLSAPTFETDGALCTMYMESSAKLSIRTFERSVACDEKFANGDTLTHFFADKERFFAIICDGMGSGSEANATSRLSTSFLERILPSPVSIKNALSVLNTFIRSKSAECSSSVDLFELDLITGKGSFVKSGAAPSFVKRDSKVFKLHSKTAPIGIMKFPDAEELSLSLCPNDTVIMISDGIASGEEDCDWLVRLISDHQGDTASLCDKILAEAKHHNRVKDDMSVMALTIF
ncbi:MAG: SpoIIE family protein phosphatase [Clostridia bacterium]|nr:SpoIIE family protein phosphatase [Clostridia bacterium]